MVDRLGADGLQTVGLIESDACCPPICGAELCALICSFIQLLPSGPMWDYHKARAMSYYNQSGVNPCEPACPPPFPCPSLVQHAIYAAIRLQSFVQGALWQVFREQSAYTATELTLDAWLESLQWEDCYNQHCRSVLLGELSPYEVAGDCAPVFCPPTVSAALQCAIKKALIIALSRQQMGVIRTLNGLNWIIEPLGAELRPATEEEMEQYVSDCDADDPVCCCATPHFILCNVGDTLPACNSIFCDNDPSLIQLPVSMVIDRGCEAQAGLPRLLYPSVLAAECILRSLLPYNCPNTIHRCCEGEN